MTPDCELLRRYTENRSENAFAELVRRHLDLVYSSAVRQVNGDTHLAQDIAQTVFSDLARKAATLLPRKDLAGWLYTSTHFAAAKAVRTESRRREREREAQIMHELIQHPGSEPDWEKLQPVLDQAMHELNEADREAILLRYFQNSQHAVIGERLGINENAARMRVERALEKLRDRFSHRGIAVSAGALAIAVSANAVQAAPVGLVVTISTAGALAGTTLATTATATATKAIAMTTLQKTLITATIAAAVATPVAIQHQAQVKLRDENASLRQQIEQLSPLTVENERLSNLLSQASPALPKDQLNDLLRLRSEVGNLRRQTNELGKLREENRRLQGAMSKAGQNSPAPNPPKDTAAQVDFPRETWAFAGYTNPESAILSLASAAVGGDLETFLNSLTPHFRAEQQERWQREGKNDIQIRDHLVKEFGRTETIRILNKENISENEIILSLLVDQGGGRSEMPKMKVQRIGDEWKMAGPDRPPRQEEP